MKKKHGFLALVLGLFGLATGHVMAEQAERHCPVWQQADLPMLHSKQRVNLCQLMQGKPVMIINTASHCGFTGQFAGLEALHQKYQDQGLVVIGFPSNDFRQEANNETEIAEVCYKNYGVSFIMTGPVHVTGDNALPLFKHLANQSSVPQWNFNKYLIDAQGRVTAHFPATTAPESGVLAHALEKILQESP